MSEREPTAAERVGDGIQAGNADWSFDVSVSADRFQGHLSKSVPFYEQGHDLILRLSDFFLRGDAVCYDLGTSTGALLEKLVRRHAGAGAKKTGLRWIAVDSEESMIRRCRERMEDSAADREDAPPPNITYECANLADVRFAPADFVTAYYVLQFVAPAERPGVLANIYEALRPGGAFVLFEKLRAPDARFQDIWTSLYTEYKLEQGFSSEEILAKSRSLKGVLEPWTLEENEAALRSAGFEKVVGVFQYACFTGLLAVK